MTEHTDKKAQKTGLMQSLIAFNGISILGNTLSEFAIPWLILETTGSPSYVGILLGFRFVPVFLSTLIGGGLIDRFTSIKVSKYSDLLNFFAVMMIPLLYNYEQLNMALLVMLIFFSSVLDSPGRAAKDVIFAGEIDHYKLKNERYNGANSLVESACDAFGPVLAGLLIGAYGVVNLLWFDAFSFLVPVIGLLLLQKYLIPPIKVDQLEKNQISDWLVGFAYIYRHRETLMIVLLSAIISLAISVLLFLYLPIFARNILDSSTDQGLIMFCFAAGTISSTLLYSLVGERIEYRNLLYFGLLGLGLSLVAINFASGFWSFAIIIAILGGFLGFSGPLEAGYLQKQIPPPLRAKVFSAYGGLRQLLVPIAAPFIGYYLEFISPIQKIDDYIILPNVMLYLGLLLLLVNGLYAYSNHVKDRRG